MGRVAGDEHPPDAQLRGVPVMDAEVAAPVQGARLDLGWRPLLQYLLHEFERRRIALGPVEGGHDAAASGAHRKDGDGTELARAQLQFARRQRIIRLDVSQHERVFVLRALERQCQEPPDCAVRPVAADDERGGELSALSAVLDRRADPIATVDGRHQSGLVFNGTAAPRQRLHQQLLGDALRHHRNQPVGALFWRKAHVGQPPSVSHDGDRRDRVGALEEWPDESGHVENFQRPGKDRERLRVHRLRCVGLNQPHSQAAAGAFVREEQAHGPGADDQDVSVQWRVSHDAPPTMLPTTRPAGTCRAPCERRY
jgi:hypothetical protein